MRHIILVAIAVTTNSIDIIIRSVIVADVAIISIVAMHIVVITVAGNIVLMRQMAMRVRSL